VSRKMIGEKGGNKLTRLERRTRPPRDKEERLVVGEILSGGNGNVYFDAGGIVAWVI